MRALTSYDVMRKGMGRGVRVLRCNHNGPALVAAVLWGAMVYGVALVVLTVGGW
jgi:hypothetical protein